MSCFLAHECALKASKESSPAGHSSHKRSGHGGRARDYWGPSSHGHLDMLRRGCLNGTRNVRNLASQAYRSGPRRFETRSLEYLLMQ